jgi:Protein of unknown function (DUF2889)
VRRTSTVDGFRPDGPLGPVILTGRARDLQCQRGGDLLVDEAFMEVEVDWIHGQIIRRVDVRPRNPGFSQLIGIGARIGFRDAYSKMLPNRWGDGSLLTLLFDELPITSSLSRHGLIQNGTISLHPRDQDPAALASRRPRGESDLPICAAWIPGGAYVQAVRRSGTPLLTEGLPAPPLVDPADANGWHAVPPLRPTEFRRRRRIDVNPPSAPGRPIEVTSLLRDTYANDSGEELVIHEYEATLTVEPLSNIVLSAAAHPRSLPGPDCPQAAQSATRIVGLRLEQLREHVRATFHGLTTCSHLNDHLRALGDTHRLLESVTLLGEDS